MHRPTEEEEEEEEEEEKEALKERMINDSMYCPVEEIAVPASFPMMSEVEPCCASLAHTIRSRSVTSIGDPHMMKLLIGPHLHRVCRRHI